MEKTYDLYHMGDGECAKAIFEIADAAAIQGFTERTLLRYGVWYMAFRRGMDEAINSSVTASEFIKWARDWSLQNGR